MQNLNAEIISIGTEILLGEITDTNSVYIAQVFRELGINLYFMTSVGDNEVRIAQAIEIALSRAHIVITCGGLGPTIDDMTRNGVALATKRELKFHQDLLDQIAGRFAGFRVRMTENNRRQAYLPDGAVVVENPVGTAPSFIVEHEDRIVISLPGVPREMKYLLNEKIVPYIQERYQLGVIKTRTLRTAGIGESALDDLIGQELLQQSNPTVGLAAHQGQVDIRITAKADDAAQAETMIEAVVVDLRSRVGQYIFGTNGDTIEGVLVQLLYAVGASIAVSETGMGEVASSLLKTVDHENKALASTSVYDHPTALREKHHADDQMPLRDLAVHVAEQIRKESGAALGIAIVCYPDVAENDDTSQSSAVAVAAQDKTRSRAYGFGGKYDLARSWTASWALSAAWQMLREKVETD